MLGSRDVAFTPLDQVGNFLTPLFVGDFDGTIGDELNGIEESRSRLTTRGRVTERSTARWLHDRDRPQDRAKG
jgi:hypothetical protein